MITAAKTGKVNDKPIARLGRLDKGEIEIPAAAANMLQITDANLVAGDRKASELGRDSIPANRHQAKPEQCAVQQEPDGQSKPNIHTTSSDIG